jgi:hypothetical protein
MPFGQITPLDSLHARLRSAFEAGLRRPEEWTDDSANSRMAADVKARHDAPGRPPNPATVLAAVSYFRTTGEPDGWRGLKRVCFGAGMLDNRGWSLLADDRLRSKLLDLAQNQVEARKRVRCFQFLLSSYWAFPLQAADEKTKAGWVALREWLHKRLRPISTDLTRMPAWFQTLVKHHNLLRDDPCGRYGPDLLSGNGAQFQTVLTQLGIPSDSWVPEEAIVAQIRAACDLQHEGFRAALPDLLKVVTGQAGLAPAKALQIRCIAMLVVRYAKIPGAPEHPLLRDAAVNVIGNPWLHRASWDANVLDGLGKPDHGAREMVFGWLKRRLIKDFFELLSADGAGDSRRLNYWLRFEPFVDDMWFALGANARQRRGETFEDFRARAKGRLLNLEKTTADNNAFVMRIGHHLAMECGENGNALYLYRWDELPPAVSQTLLSGKDKVDVTIHQLKNSEHIATEKPLRHVDSPKALESWEQKFDAAVCPILGCKPETRPAYVGVLETLLQKYRISAEDKRPQGGAFWVYTNNASLGFNAQIQALGFQYRAPQGWFKES